MRNLFLSVSIFVSFLASNEVALASCSVPNSVKKEAETAAVIFVGRVIKITPAQIADADLVDSKNLKWEKRFKNTDVATFAVTEAFKGVSSEAIEIATSAEGDANYKFEGGTWLKVGEVYLVYANKIIPAGTVDEDSSRDGYSPATIAEFRKIQKSFPKKLAASMSSTQKLALFMRAFAGERTASIKWWKNFNRFANYFPKPKSLTNRKMDRKIIQWFRFGNVFSFSLE